MKRKKGKKSTMKRPMYQFRIKEIIGQNPGLLGRIIVVLGKNQSTVYRNIRGTHKPTLRIQDLYTEKLNSILGTSHTRQELFAIIDT